MSNDQVSRGVPAQDLPENQDPTVAHTVDQTTGIKYDFDGNEIEDEDDEPEPPKKEKGRPKKESAGAEREVPTPANVKGSRELAAATSAREIGS